MMVMRCLIDEEYRQKVLLMRWAHKTSLKQLPSTDDIGLQTLDKYYG